MPLELKIRGERVAEREHRESKRENRGGEIWTNKHLAFRGL